MSFVIIDKQRIYCMYFRLLIYSFMTYFNALLLMKFSHFKKSHKCIIDIHF